MQVSLVWVSLTSEQSRGRHCPATVRALNRGRLVFAILVLLCIRTPLASAIRAARPSDTRTHKGRTPSTSGPVGTYDQQYPSNYNAFGLGDELGFQNTHMVRFNLDLTLAKILTVLVQAENLKLVSVHDAIYSSAGTALGPAPANGFAIGQIGYGGDISAKCVYHQSLVWNAGIAYLGGGNIHQLNTKANHSTYGYLSATFRFGLRY